MASVYKKRNISRMTKPKAVQKGLKVQSTKRTKAGRKLKVILKPNTTTTDRTATWKTHNKDSSSGSAHYMVFDKLIARIVGQHADGKPLIQFEQQQNNKDLPQLPTECGICGDIMDRSILTKHLAMHKKVNVDRFACPYCSRTFQCYLYIAAHIRDHKNIRPYECKACKKYFTTNQGLSLHNLHCPSVAANVPSGAFSISTTKTSLMDHQLDTLHCQWCHKIYSRVHALEAHLHKKHAEFGRLPCTLCRRTFINSKNLMRHRQKFHGILNRKGTKLRSCLKIDFSKRVKEKPTLRIQVKSERITCALCQSTFINCSTLMQHQKKYHHRSGNRIILYPTFQ